VETSVPSFLQAFQSCERRDRNDRVSHNFHCFLFSAQKNFLLTRRPEKSDEKCRVMSCKRHPTLNTATDQHQQVLSRKVSWNASRHVLQAPPHSQHSNRSTSTDVNALTQWHRHKNSHINTTTHGHQQINTSAPTQSICTTHQHNRVRALNSEFDDKGLWPFRQAIKAHEPNGELSESHAIDHVHGSHSDH
jgi:hypothetical protein